MWNIFLIDLSSLLRTTLELKWILILQKLLFDLIFLLIAAYKISYMEHNLPRIVFYQRKHTKEDNIFP